jgi:hypothetical protein
VPVFLFQTRRLEGSVIFWQRGRFIVGLICHRPIFATLAESTR